METQRLYGQDATHFTLRFVLGPDPTMDGRLVLELADTFLDQLLFPGSPPISIWTKAPGMGKQMSIAEFSNRRWETARKKIKANASAVLRLEAKTTDFPNQTIALNVHANPPGGNETIHSGVIDVTCSIPYLRHVSASRDMVDALMSFGVQVWTRAKPAYGFGNLAAIPRRAGLPFAEGGPPDLDLVPPPAERVHPIPVAATGNDIDGNLDDLIVKGRGIKGSYWANFLSTQFVQMAGGADLLASRLSGLRIEPLGDGGLLIVATDSPLPQDSEDNRSRFQRLEAALRPAFLSRAETPENKRALLGQFYREKSQ
jgi:hypothetical protein